jgi:hypothetical protein
MSGAARHNDTRRLRKLSLHDLQNRFRKGPQKGLEPYG